MADQPLIIKRIKKGGHAAHGGAWKVAYADFVTAMMAFFLLLWLLNAVTEEQLEGISNYFAPTAVSMSPSGAGGVLGGQVLGEGASQSNSGSPSVQLTLPPPTIGAGGQDYTDANEGLDATDENADIPMKGDPNAYPDDTSLDGLGKVGMDAGDGQGQSASEAALAAAQDQKQQREFNKTAAEIRQAIQAVPSLKAMADSLLIDNTPEGLRIQLVDQDGLSMFPSGSSRVPDQTRQLLSLVAKAIADLPNKISIAGHTDATPFVDPSGYGNWELSADRALASRRTLTNEGLAENRIDRVEGKASTEPLLPEDPTSERNRRITITLLRDRDLFKAGGAEGAPGGTGPADGATSPGAGGAGGRMPSILDVPRTNQL
ncbi:MAG: OmpA family protein [Rhodospirillum sp.]|nr:OmpA family protein [Rhodospirillum sp.]MCF8490403.1 OmpA family protein [Rhodospirillum sp.]MCF8500324.1 OmpA family protein [Rhodospirillum sp.]